MRENPRDLKAALSYARNLKAMGEKRRALARAAAGVASSTAKAASSPANTAVSPSTSTRCSVAKKLLDMADDPAKPDWRVISARGAALAKEGNYNEAIPLFERALSLAHNQPSVLSNLALAYAMNGEPNKAESMLRQAAASDSNSPRIRQNLALVLGLQGKYDEAKLVAARDIPMTNASENADYLRQVVKLDPKSVPNSDPQPAEWNTRSQHRRSAGRGRRAGAEGRRRAAMPPIDAKAVQDTAWIVTTMSRRSPAPVAEAKADAAPEGDVGCRDGRPVRTRRGQRAGGKAEEDRLLRRRPLRRRSPSRRSWSPLVAQAKR